MMPAYALQLKSIECVNQNEFTQDEPYLNFNGSKIWSGDMDQGDTIDLSSTNPIQFSGSANLSLWEDDPGIWGFDKDDYLGTAIVYDWQHWGSTFALDFTGGDAHYKLTVDVLYSEGWA
jgi:hypothetical protein